MSKVIARTVQKNTAKEGKIRVHSSQYGIEAEDVQIIEVATFPEGTVPAYVHVGAGRTINLGDYNSLKLDVSITLPCYVEEVDDVRTVLSAKVSEILAEECSLYCSTKEG